jgi:excisionase family DNA binding protein
MNNEPLAYSIEDACAASGLGKTKIYEAMAAGQLSKVKLGRRTLILRSDLLKYLESGRESA